MVHWKIRSPVESHPKHIGQRGTGGQRSRDILWNFICGIAYLFSRLCKKTSHNFCQTAEYPIGFQHKYTHFWRIIINYQETPFLSFTPSSLFSLFSTIRQAMHRQPLSTCFHWLCRFLYSAHKKCQWLTASVANASKWKPYSQFTCVSAAEKAGIPESD